MRTLSKSLLCVATALLLAGTASAERIGVVGGGSHCNGNYYAGSVSSTFNNITGLSYASHPTYQGCVDALAYMVGHLPAAYVYRQCRLVICPSGWAEAGFSPDFNGRMIGLLREEQALRELHGIDAYEAELQALWAVPVDGDNGP